MPTDRSVEREFVEFGESGEATGRSFGGEDSGRDERDFMELDESDLDAKARLREGARRAGSAARQVAGKAREAAAEADTENIGQGTDEFFFGEGGGGAGGNADDVLFGPESGSDDETDMNDVLF